MYCLAREHPDSKAHERVRSTLMQYNLLASPGVKLTDEQVNMEALFNSRVYCIKGTSICR